ncbi:hypothetical protein ACFLUS_01555 [Chloroflexota bacterium]
MLLLFMSCHLKVLLLPIVLLVLSLENSPPDKYPAATGSGENLKAGVQLPPLKRETALVFRTVACYSEAKLA